MQKGRPGPGRGHKSLKAAGSEMLAPLATAPAAATAVGTDAVCPTVNAEPQGVGTQQPDGGHPVANLGTADNVSTGQLSFISKE